MPPYYGAAALYECDGNFELDGFARLCLGNDIWSSDSFVKVIGRRYLFLQKKIMKDIVKNKQNFIMF